MPGQASAGMKIWSGDPILSDPQRLGTSRRVSVPDGDADGPPRGWGAEARTQENRFG